MEDEFAANDNTVCIDRFGDAYPEHDYNEVDCVRCGAEPEDGA